MSFTPESPLRSMERGLSWRGAATRRWEWAGLALVILLAAVLRLGAPGITEFKRDEGNLSQLALDVVHGRDLPLLGLSSSVNVPNPPISVYLFTIPFAWSDSPIPATLFVGALNVIAVGLVWWLARRYYGSVAALTAGVLYAAGPWAVLYSRKIWAQDLLPPFVVVTVFTGLTGYGEGKRWARWAHWPLLAITVQIHYGAFTLIPLSLLVLALWPQRVKRRDLLIGLGIAALTVLPALIGAYQDGWLSLDTLRDGLNENPDHVRVISTTALDYAWFTVAGTDIHSLAGPEQFRRYLDSVPDVYPLFKLVPLVTVLAAAGLIWRVIRQRRVRQSPDLVMVAWLALPVIAFTWEWTEVAPHYMIPLMPAAYILCGAGLETLWQAVQGPRLRRAVLAGGVMLVLIIAGWQVYLLAELLRFLDTHATPGGFGTPLHYLMDVRAAILEQNPRDVIVYSDQELAPFDEIPAVWGVLLEPLPSVRFVNGTRTVVMPSEGNGLELIVSSPSLRISGTDTSNECNSCVQYNGPPSFTMRPGEAPYTLRLVQHDLRPFSGAGVSDTPHFANGVYLFGYAVNQNSVMLEWLLGASSDTDYQAFVHALNANGEKLAQADRPFWPGRYWRAGDTLILWYDLTLPPETAALHVGMYTIDGATYHNVEVVDAQGGYVDQAATIQLSSP
jgi:4-amino-4-deoxy-L-arabinose transferase-like glycosyltransferase